MSKENGMKVPHKFISQYGVKKLGANEFLPEMDITDQRAPITSAEELWSTYMMGVDDEVQDELDSETLEDFENDVYPYDDISEFGEDILTAAQPDIAREGQRLFKKKTNKNK